jgi:hypothetical protein
MRAPTTGRSEVAGMEEPGVIISTAIAAGHPDHTSAFPVLNASDAEQGRKGIEGGRIRRMNAGTQSLKRCSYRWFGGVMSLWRRVRICNCLHQEGRCR